MTTFPDPSREIRIVGMRSVRGANYWSRRPVTRMDVQLGAYENISSADAPWMAIQLAAALPGLVEHRCSVGERGGFLKRLRDGTYAAHIAEHVALELQSSVGHETGYGRTRGTGVEGEYTIVLEHRHEAVGRRAAEVALEIVRRAFASTLESVEPAIAELRALAAEPDAPHVRDRVHAGITGGAGRAHAREALAKARGGAHGGAHGSAHGSARGGAHAHPRVGHPVHPAAHPAHRAEMCAIVDVAPAELLDCGLPYAHSDIAVILDASPADVPPRYRDADRAARLVAIVADAVPPGGIVVCPADAYLVHDIVRDAGRLVRTFAPSTDIAERAARAACTAHAALESASAADSVPGAPATSRAEV